MKDRNGQPITPNNLLEEIGLRIQPTKIGHDYLKHYWNHFRDIRFQVRNLIEIGVQEGNSLRLWEEFFPNATIHGIDIDPNCKQSESDRIRVHIGDQSNEAFIKNLLDDIAASPDIVIDDGSHIPTHQLGSFAWLYPALSAHGIYVMEDTGGCVGDEALLTVSTLQSLIKNIFYWPLDLHGSQWWKVQEFDERATWMDKNTVGIAFYRWIVFIMRGNNPGDNRFLPPIPT